MTPISRLNCGSETAYLCSILRSSFFSGVAKFIAIATATIVNMTVMMTVTMRLRLQAKVVSPLSPRDGGRRRYPDSLEPSPLSGRIVLLVPAFVNFARASFFSCEMPDLKVGHGEKRMARISSQQWIWLST
jgi:hypothetical protein